MFVWADAGSPHLHTSTEFEYDRDVDTPHLDAMARDGVKATYVTPPFLTVTSPTHFTILTGKPSHLDLYDKTPGLLT